MTIQEFQSRTQVSVDVSEFESIGISLESEPDNNGFRHFKRFSELRPEINAFLKNA
jgi:hypothetical protein